MMSWYWNPFLITDTLWGKSTSYRRISPQERLITRDLWQIAMPTLYEYDRRHCQPENCPGIFDLVYEQYEKVDTYSNSPD